MSEESGRSASEQIEQHGSDAPPIDSPSGGDDTDQWALVAVAFILGGFLGAVSNPNDPLFAFFVIGGIAGGVAWAFSTESGKAWRENIVDEMNEAQQQQGTTNSSSTKPKLVCQSCGWQNPAINKYCHDCGGEIAQ